ncbi:MAG: acetolactate decarboxylase [Acidobacteriaceae bacterium]
MDSQSRATHDPISHIVAQALARHFNVPHHTLYQVSTSTALVEGVYEGAVRIGTLRRHGDLGLGTFENLDGEMVVVDGHFYQVRSNGSVSEVEDDVLTPFATITSFSPDSIVELPQFHTVTDLTANFDRLRESENIFYALRVDGHFDYVHARAVRRTEEGVSLVQATALQPEFEFHNLPGTLVGFWTPEYARTINVPGYHLHFLSADHTRGGHILECSGRNCRLQIQQVGNLHVALPETENFLTADLRRDPSADLARAEGKKK